MKITKFLHSCLLVEIPDRTALFDPGKMSEEVLDVEKLKYLDDIFITHEHADHFSLQLVKKLVDKFPQVRITSTAPVVKALKQENIEASVTAPLGVSFFSSPHEDIQPLAPRPIQMGFHYLDVLTHPGDSHSFNVTSAILALPITAPWGSLLRALNLALELRPTYVIPIHDWHLRDEARAAAYDLFDKFLSDQNLRFIRPETGVPFTIKI